MAEKPNSSPTSTDSDSPPMEIPNSKFPIPLILPPVSQQSPSPSPPTSPKTMMFKEYLKIKDDVARLEKVLVDHDEKMKEWMKMKEEEFELKSKCEQYKVFIITCFEEFKEACALNPNAKMIIHESLNETELDLIKDDSSYRFARVEHRSAIKRKRKRRYSEKKSASKNTHIRFKYSDDEEDDDGGDDGVGADDDGVGADSGVDHGGDNDVDGGVDAGGAKDVDGGVDAVDADANLEARCADDDDDDDDDDVDADADANLDNAIN